MCDPISMAVVAVATTATSLVAQQQSADAQRAVIEQQLQQNYDNIAKDKQAQENDQLRASRREASRIKVAAGEAGLSLGSQSIETMLLNNQMQTGLNNERIGLNTEAARQNAQGEANRMLSETATPTALGAGLQLGLAAANGYMSGKNLQIKRDSASSTAAKKAGS